MSIRVVVLIFLLWIQASLCRDVILEFKGAYFVPTNSTFQEMYKNSFLYGPELTVQLKKNSNWYAFAAVDYTQVKGRFLSLGDSTHIGLLGLTPGIKYFVHLTDRSDFYFGVGFQATHLRTKSRRACVTARESQWAFGATEKIGTYIGLPHNFVLDLFFDYRFLKTTGKNTILPFFTPKVSGATFGAALGYRF